MTTGARGDCSLRANHEEIGNGEWPKTQNEFARFFCSGGARAVPLHLRGFWRDFQREMEPFRPLHRMQTDGPYRRKITARCFKIGLTKESIQSAAESRLRSARLYRSIVDAQSYLFIVVTVTSRAFSILLRFEKYVRDPFTDIVFLATTWDTGSIGTHGGSAGPILSELSRHMDHFLVEFLRVNEKACEKR